MKACKKCKEVTCIGCYETKCNKLRRKYYKLKWIIESYIEKLFKDKVNDHEENWDNWKNNNWDDWNNKEYECEWGDEQEYIELKESFNFEKETIKDIDEIMICVSEGSNWKECDKIEIPIGIIRYSQRKINPLFQSRNGELFRNHINDVIRGLKNKEIVYGKDLPIIEVVIKESKIYSMDNRRLYCLKEIFESDEKIYCKYRKDNKNFQRKRLQAEYERKSLGDGENFDYRSVVIDMYARGKEFVV